MVESTSIFFRVQSHNNCVGPGCCRKIYGKVRVVWVNFPVLVNGEDKQSRLKQFLGSDPNPVYSAPYAHLPSSFLLLFNLLYYS